MAVAFETIGFLHLKKPDNQLLLLPRGASQLPTLAVKRFTPMAALTSAPTVGLSETFKRLKKQGQVCVSLAINPLYHMGFAWNHIVIFALLCFFRFFKLLYTYINFFKFYWVICYGWTCKPNTLPLAIYPITWNLNGHLRIIEIFIEFVVGAVWQLGKMWHSFYNQFFVFEILFGQ